MAENRLGKIKSIHFGFLEKNQFGVAFTFSGYLLEIGEWEIDCLKTVLNPVELRNNWEVSTSQRYISYRAEIITLLAEIMAAAKVTKLEELINKPIEITLDNQEVQSWRILTEVL